MIRRPLGISGILHKLWVLVGSLYPNSNPKPNWVTSSAFHDDHWAPDTHLRVCFAPLQGLRGLLVSLDKKSCCFKQGVSKSYLLSSFIIIYIVPSSLPPTPPILNTRKACPRLQPTSMYFSRIHRPTHCTIAVYKILTEYLNIPIQNYILE